MRTKVFLDSGIFIAFINRRDKWHKQAVSLFGGKNPEWHSSVLVRAESYSWFLHKLGEESARSFRMMFDNLENLTIHPADEDHHNEVVKMLERHRGAKLTYVDASSLALMAQNRIRSVWSTDHHLGLTGAEVLPRF